jgi:hypothetical protein
VTSASRARPATVPQPRRPSRQDRAPPHLRGAGAVGCRAPQPGGTSQGAAVCEPPWASCSLLPYGFGGAILATTYRLHHIFDPPVPSTQVGWTRPPLWENHPFMLKGTGYPRYNLKFTGSTHNFPVDPAFWL